MDDFKFFHATPVPTEEAKALRIELEKLGCSVLEEIDDGYKHIDLAIPKARMDIEVDGLQHYTDTHQILSDLKRSHYSDRAGYDTIHISNMLLSLHLKEIAEALAKAAKIRARQLYIKFHLKPKTVV